MNNRLERDSRNAKILNGLKSVKKAVPLGYQYKRLIQRANYNIYINHREEIKIPSFEDIKD
jgi:hypothetical protein